MLDDRTSTTGFDAHYVYLGAWAFRNIVREHPAEHVDVGSQISWVTCLASVSAVTFIDIRPFDGNVEGLKSIAGSVLEMPYADQTIYSLSCLHVAEHIGLGRYGDPLDPLGTMKAIRELARILAPGGRLYFALPVGKDQIVFNAHRVHRPSAIIAEFNTCGLRLVDFGAVTDGQQFIASNAQPAAFESAEYACGMFVFTR